MYMGVYFHMQINMVQYVFQSNKREQLSPCLMLIHFERHLHPATKPKSFFIFLHQYSILPYMFKYYVTHKISE